MKIMQKFGIAALAALALGSLVFTPAESFPKEVKLLRSHYEKKMKKAKK